ncbi:MAG: hypothetical protein KC582_04850 [Candidatus Magasanikbacteria bacterium]|nr:hypothetical protein [Candidatus Magasanikbacteria bacterium]
MDIGPLRRIQKERGVYVLVPYLYIPRRHDCGHIGTPSYVLEINGFQIRFTRGSHDVVACVECELEEYLKSLIHCPRCKRVILKYFYVAKVGATKNDKEKSYSHFLDDEKRYVLVCKNCTNGQLAAYGWWDGKDQLEFY